MNVITIVLICGSFLLLQVLLIVLYAIRKISNANREAARILNDAKKEAETKIKEMTVEVQERLFATENKMEEESKQRRKELIALEKKQEQREKNLERKLSYVESKQQELNEREAGIKETEIRLTEKETALQAAIVTQRRKLENIAGMTAEMAKNSLMKEFEEDARREATETVKEILEEAREKAEDEALKIITHSIQRSSSKNFMDLTVTSVELPNDEMKGRIIGREGRNIRSIEMATGVDLIIDDTPRTIILSGFDPLRREIARIAIMKLVEDGRIHPARIEEVIEKVKEEFDAEIQNIGEATAFEQGITDLHPRLTKLIGKLKFRSDLGLNLLNHSIEVAHIAGHMASELGVRKELVTRAGLLHEIGHVAESNSTSSPLIQSAELTATFGESDEVVQAIQSFQKDAEAKTVEAALLQMAEMISNSRPRSQNENLEKFISRLTKLEEVALSMKGVKSAYAIRAGKELRVIVESDKISDDDTIWLSKDIAHRIKTEMNYPGQIKVVVIRETRGIDFAV
jgi:ribonuclease Y